MDDRSGNRARAELTLEDHDGTPPFVVLEPGADPPIRARRSPTRIGAFFSDDVALAQETLHVFLDGQEITDQLARTPFSAEGTFTLAQGLHLLEAHIEDARGSLTVESARFLVDDTPPQVTVSVPDPAGPDDEIVVRAVDPEAGLAAAVQVLVNGLDLSPFARRSVGLTTLRLGDVPVALLPEGPRSVEGRAFNRAGNLGQAFAATSYDRTGPALSATPADGATTDDETPTLLVTWSDGPGAGADPGSFVATVDSQRLTFVVGPDGAEATLALEDGEHTLQLELRDTVGNRTQRTVHFTVNARAVAYALSLEPGDPSAVLIHTENDLVLRALTLSGRTATSHAGTVTLHVSDGLAPLDGLVTTFDPARDQGLLTIPRLAFFRSAGELTVTARSLAGDVTGRRTPPATSRPAPA